MTKVASCSEVSPWAASVATRLALGTVQMGLAYGVANSHGRMAPEEAGRVLEQARAYGFDTLDTAVAYGESEQRLGKIGVAGWSIVSKLPGIADHGGDARVWLGEQVRASLVRLRVRQLHGLLLHRPDDLAGPNGRALWLGLEEARAAGLVRKIGVSIYAPMELDTILPSYPVQIVQAPFNLLDRRLVKSGWLRRLADQGVEVHTRSVFLQGLLLMKERPVRFTPWASLLSGWDAWRATHDEEGVTTCLRFALSRPEIDKVVVGVDSAAQLRGIVAAAGRADGRWPEDLWSEDPVLLNPALWPR